MLKIILSFTPFLRYFVWHFLILLGLKQVLEYYTKSDICHFYTSNCKKSNVILEKCPASFFTESEANICLSIYAPLNDFFVLPHPLNSRNDW